MNGFNNGTELLRQIQSGEMKLEDAKGFQNTFKLNLNKISRVRFKSKQQSCPLENLKLIYELRQAAFKLFNVYYSVASKAKHKVKYGEGLKILTPRQMLQKLKIVLVQDKGGSSSENLLNEVRQTMYSLY